MFFQQVGVLLFVLEKDDIEFPSRNPHPFLTGKATGQRGFAPPVVKEDLPPHGMP